MQPIELDNPTIILLGGAAGTGKTSLAKILCHELDITHRLGSGFIREMAKSFVSQQDNAFLYNYSFRPSNGHSPFQNLYKQSEVIKDSIERCIKRAFDEGTSILIEGVNVIPGLINPMNASLSAVLVVEDYDLHYSRIKGKTHFKRDISREDFERVRMIQEDFKLEANAKDWKILDVRSFESVVAKIKELLNNCKSK